MLNSVKVPVEYEAVFKKAQDYISRYFADRELKMKELKANIVELESKL